VAGAAVRHFRVGAWSWMPGSATQTPTGIRRAHEFSCPPPSCGELGRLSDGGGLDLRAYKIGRLCGARYPDPSTVVKRVVGVPIVLKPMGTVPLAVWQPPPPTVIGSAATDVVPEER
jgi:hypothetical protein